MTQTLEGFVFDLDGTVYLGESALPGAVDTLAPGQGLICNNVLHDRTGFHDNGPARLLYRGRYYDRITGTEQVAATRGVGLPEGR